MTAKTNAMQRTNEAKANGAPGKYWLVFGLLVQRATAVNKKGPIIPAIPLSELFAPDSWPCSLAPSCLDMIPCIDALKNPINAKMNVKTKNNWPVQAIE